MKKHLRSFLLILSAIAFACYAAEQINIDVGGIHIGGNAADKIGLYGVTPVVQPSSADQAALVDNTGGSVSGSTLADGLTATAITDSSGGTPGGTIAAATNLDALTGTLTGTLDNALADLTAATAAEVTGTLTGSADGVVEDVAAISLDTTDTYSDASVNAAVNTAITAANLQLKELQLALNEVVADNAARKLVSDKNTKELQAELTTQRALNTVLINAIASLAAKTNTVVTDITTQNSNDAKQAELINAIRAALVLTGGLKGSS